MPRALTDSLVRHLLAAAPADRPYGPAELDRLAAPSSIRTYLRHALRDRARAEAEGLPPSPSPWFDAEADEVRRARRAFHEALARNPQIPASAWEALVREAAERVVAYLARPVPALTQHVFREAQGALSVREIDARTAYLTPYPHLPKVVTAYLADKGIASMTQPELRSLLERIDRQGIKDFDPGAWLDMLAPFFEVARAAGAEGLPAETLAAFFRDKDRADLAARLPSAGALDADALRALLEAPAPQRPLPDERPAPPLPERARPSSPAPSPVPLWQQFQHSGPQATRTEPRAPEAPAPGDGASQPLWQRFRGAGPSAPSQTPRPPRTAGADTGRTSAGTDTARLEAPTTTWSPPLDDGGDLALLEQTVLGPGAQHRALFVERLFSGQPEAYAATLARLKAAPSWKEASQIIARDVFRAHHVNIYSEEAVAFTDAVEARFRA